MDIKLKQNEKDKFCKLLKKFTEELGSYISKDGEWTVKGFIDIFKNIYTISNDTKIVSKILELHIFPHFLKFATDNNYDLELASFQNWYPDMTFISKKDRTLKFAVDLKTTHFIFFAEEKWKIASDKSGSGNTANIGSIQKISDILSGNGIFSKAGEEYFDDYWANFGKIEVKDKNGKYKKMSSFQEYLEYRGLPKELYNLKAPKRKEIG